ncbi:MAG: response regulator [Phycisphaerae bacterium]|nr:response regulator [Phycisphaerae bacterium]
MSRIVAARVLVLDDDDAQNRKLAATLAAAQCDVSTFTVVDEALAFARRAAVHVALVDAQFPDQEPIALLTKLRDAGRSMRLVAMAAFPDVALTTALLRGGASDLLEKPIQPARLISAIEKQMAELGLEHRNEEQLLAFLGRRLRTLRAADGRTQSEVAEAAGISPAQLSQIESGKSATGLWTLARLSAELGCPLRDLFHG